MSFEDQPRHHADTFVGRIRTDLERIVRDCLDEVLDTAAREREEAVEAALASARAETSAAVEAGVASARDAWAVEQEGQLALALAQAREEARAEARDEARQEMEAAVADAHARAWDDARATFEAQLAQVRDEAQDELQRAVADARAEAARDVAEAVARAEATLQAAAEQEPLEAALPPDPGPAADERPRGIDAQALRDAVARLDEATSLSECLDALSDGVARHAARAMVFVLRGHVLRAWRLSGFPEATPSPSSLSVPLDLSGDLWQVAERGRQKEVHPQAFGRDTDPALAFACLEGGPAGLATPVLVAGRTVAVVYADGGEAREAAGEGWPACIEMLTRHASRCLEALTATRAASAAAPHAAQVVGRIPPTPTLVSPVEQAPAAEPPAPPDLEAVTAAERYAKLLVSEVKLYNEAAVRVARHKKDIRTRLRAEIDRARRLYHERVPAGVATRDEIFDRELLRTLADGQPELLGTDMPEAV